jgi:hypothetical protein
MSVVLYDVLYGRSIDNKFDETHCMHIWLLVITNAYIIIVQILQILLYDRNRCYDVTPSIYRSNQGYAVISRYD